MKIEVNGHPTPLADIETAALNEFAALINLELGRRAEAVKEAAAREILDKAAAMGLDLEAIAKRQRRRSPKLGVKVPPRYQDPYDPRNVWSGRGKRPVWMREAIKLGISVEQMEIGR